MVQNGKEFSGMKIKQVECAFGMNQCATVNYEVNIPSLKKFGLKLKATQAMCTTSVLNCQICSAIKKTLKMSSISKCDVSFINCFLLQFFSYHNTRKMKFHCERVFIKICR